MIMNRGKDICKELKAVRRQIAEENGIVLEIPECTYKGPCRGTCPRCESEVRFLENALAEKLRLGKVASVAGIALTLASPAVAMAQSIDTVTVPPSHERQTGMCEVTGVVVDGRTREALPFANVMLYKDTARAQVVATDFDGRYRFNVPRGRYTLEVSYVGYNKYRREVVVKHSQAEQDVMELVYVPSLFDTYDTPKVDTIEMATQMMGLVVVAYKTQGAVMDEKTQEPLPFANVLVLKDGKPVRAATTDFDGNFKTDLEEGVYDFVVTFTGYEKYLRTGVKVPDDLPLKIELKNNAGVLEDVIIEGDMRIPVFDIGPDGGTNTEIQGVPLYIQY